MAPISARERRVREIVEIVMGRLKLPRAPSYNQGIEVGANSAANILLDEIDALTLKASAAIKTAAKGRK